MASRRSLAPNTQRSDAAMTSPMLNMVGEKFLPSRCRPGTVSYCPTMDLVAVVTILDLPGDDGRTEEKLSVWRLNGQQVFGWDAPTELRIPVVRWRVDGRLIALGTSDGVVRLLNVMNGGKMVHCLGPSSGEATDRCGLSCLAWGVNFGDAVSAKALLEEQGRGWTLDGLLSLGAGKDAIATMKADLPRELACGIDVETSIPKLSPLPPGSGMGSAGGDDDIFSSRASMDAIFHPNSSTSGRSSRHDEVDVLLTGFEDGTVYVRIFDCFDIGKVNLNSSLPEGTSMCKVVRHIAHPLSSTHGLIVQSTTKSSKQLLHVIALDLNFIPQTGPYYLSTLATKSTQLLNLLRYLSQISTNLSIELKGASDLSDKFIRNINETLAQSPEGPTDFVTVAYQLVVTGECNDELREWMIDEIGERNLKRWEKSSAAGMENIRRFVHECLLPALERCQVVLSRLQGLSRFSKSAPVLGLDVQSLNRTIDTVECLNLLGHYLLRIVGKEIRQFTAFIKWLRLEVEIQGLERENAGGRGSERLDEMCMRRDDVEVRTVLGYIQGVMGKSEMATFVRRPVDARRSSQRGPSYDWSESQVDMGFYEIFKKLLKTNVEPGKLPDLEDLLQRLKVQAEKVFEGIAQTLRKSILHSRVCTLPSHCDADNLHARMIAKAGEGYEVILAAKKKDAASQMSMCRVSWGQPHRSQAPAVTDLAVPRNEEIVDIGFVDDSDLMVLSSGQELAHLHTLDYTSAAPHWRERHTFDLSDGAKPPSELEVNGRKGRRAACIVEDDIRFAVFDLDSGQPGEQVTGHDADMIM